MVTVIHLSIISFIKLEGLLFKLLKRRTWEIYKEKKKKKLINVPVPLN